MTSNQGTLRPAKSSNPAPKKTTKAAVNNRNNNTGFPSSKSTQSKQLYQVNQARASYTNDVISKRKHSYTPNMSAMNAKNNIN